MSENKRKKTAKKIIDKLDHKTWIFVGFSIIALVFVIMAIVNFAGVEKYDSSYFHDADGKIVLTMDRDSASLDDSIYEPNITHMVYYYNGDKIANVKAFYEYATEKEAKIAYDHLEAGDFADGKKLAGRFVVFQVKREMFEDVAVETVRNDAELLKEIDALILDYDEGYINNYAELNFEEDDDEDIDEDEEEEDEEQD